MNPQTCVALYKDWDVDLATGTFISPSKDIEPPGQVVVFEGIVNNGTVSASITAIEGQPNRDLGYEFQEGMLMFRYTDEDHFYVAGMGGFAHKFFIAKSMKFNTPWRELRGIGRAHDLQKGKTYELRVEFVNDRITLFSDGVEVISATDDSYSSGVCGLRTNRTKVKFENVDITPLVEPRETDALSSVAAATASLLPDLLGAGAQTLTARLLEVNAKLPLLVGGGGSPRLQNPDNRISWGIARRDGKFILVILTEKEDSRSQSEARAIAQSYPSLVETKVIGRAYSVNPRGGARKTLVSPLNPGSSIGHIQGFPGTIGCIARSRRGSEDWLGVTSAAHVLSITNTAERDDTIIAPGHPDGPKNSANRCGSLARFIYLTHYSEKLTGANLLCCADVALVRIDQGYEGERPDVTWVIDPQTEQPMRVQGIIGKDEIFDYTGKTVYKVGRTTDLTEGILDLVRLQRQAIQLPDGRLYLYTDVMTVEKTGPQAFSEPGDSGALVYMADGRAIGFVIGGTEQTSFVSPIDVCLKEIEAEIVL
jgi:hypothetical protein